MYRSSVASGERLSRPPQHHNQFQDNSIQRPTPLSNSDPEHRRVSYLLQAALSSLTVNIHDIYPLYAYNTQAGKRSNPLEVFETHYSGVTVLDSWVNIHSLEGSPNSIHNILRNGGRFHIPGEDMHDGSGAGGKGALFTIGQILDDDESSGPQRHEFLLCRVAVGRPFVITPDALGTHGIPPGYDSLVIKRPLSESTSLYFYEFVVSDENRVFPAYVANFTFDPAVDRMKKFLPCEACMLRGQPQPRPAVLHDVQDNVKLCRECDEELHDVRTHPFAARHTRIPLSEMEHNVGLMMCKNCPSMPVQYYDPVAHLPVCLQCKLHGTHSPNPPPNPDGSTPPDYSRNQLVPIADAVAHTTEDMARERRVVEERRTTINAQLGSIHERMTAVRAGHERCSRQIYQLVSATLQALHDETHSKLCALLSDEVELKRQLNFYEWMEKHLQYQKGSVGILELMKLYDSHSLNMLKAPSEIVDFAREVRDDLSVVGELNVLAGGNNVNGNGQSEVLNEQQAGPSAARAMFQQSANKVMLMQSSANNMGMQPPSSHQQQFMFENERVSSKVPSRSNSSAVGHVVNRERL